MLRQVIPSLARVAWALYLIGRLELVVPDEHRLPLQMMRRRLRQWVGRGDHEVLRKLQAAYLAGNDLGDSLPEHAATATGRRRAIAERVRECGG